MKFNLKIFSLSFILHVLSCCPFCFCCAVLTVQSGIHLQIWNSLHRDREFKLTCKIPIQSKFMTNVSLEWLIILIFIDSYIACKIKYNSFQCMHIYISTHYKSRYVVCGFFAQNQLIAHSNVVWAHTTHKETPNEKLLCLLKPFSQNSLQQSRAYFYWSI